MQVSSLNLWEAQQEFLLHLEGRFIWAEFNLRMAGDRSEGLGCRRPWPLCHSEHKSGEYLGGSPIFSELLMLFVLMLLTFNCTC